MNELNIRTGWLTLNRKCHFHCEWCYANTAKNISDMDYDKAIQAVDALTEVGVKKIVLIGGEPLLYPDIIGLIDYIHRKKILVSIATNGVEFVNESVCKTICSAGVDNINISLKSTTEEGYKENVGAYGLINALTGYKNLEKNGLTPTVSYVITNSSIKEIEELIELCGDFGINNISFQYVKPIIKKDSDPIMDLQDMGIHICKLYELMEMSGIRWSVEISFPLCLIPDEYRDKIVNSGKIYSGCHIRRGSGVVFDTDFRIIPCNHFVNMPFIDSPVKSIDKESIISLRNSDEYKRFQDRISKYPGKKCENCELWDKCGGGCFTRWIFCNPEEYCKGISNKEME